MRALKSEAGNASAAASILYYSVHLSIILYGWRGWSEGGGKMAANGADPKEDEKKPAGCWLLGANPMIRDVVRYASADGSSAGDDSAVPGAVCKTMGRCKASVVTASAARLEVSTIWT